MSKKGNDFEFKDFVYLNINFLESYIAQKYKGFPEEVQASRALEDSEEKIGAREGKETDINGKVGAGIGAVEANSKMLSEGKQFNHNNTETFQNVIKIVQKDNMFNCFLNYMRQKALLAEVPNLDVGKYVDLYDNFYYIDFDRIQKLCDVKYRKIYQGYDKDSAMFSTENFEETRNKVALLNELIPFDALLFNKDYMILLDKMWFKNEKEYLGYLLDGRINVVGKICKVVQVGDEKPAVIQMLNKIQEFTLSMLRDLGFSPSDKLYLVYPIAIYH